MKRLASFLAFAFIYCAVAPAQTSPASTTLPVGTKISLALTAPVWARSAKAGDALYTQVDFPVTAGNTIAIPAGSYVQGIIQSITRPHFKSRAQIQALFSTIIFANGYAVSLPTLPAADAPTQNSLPPLAPTAMELNIDVSSANDLLLDNGAQFDIILAAPLSLDSAQIAAAIPLSHPVELRNFKSATQCRPTPGTPGTPGSPDTVIPGSPGTPSTTIPGGPGMPDTVIPGTPSTPDTVIPGTPGTPGFAGTSCPSAPIVITSVPIPYTAAHAQNSSSAHNH